MSIKAEVRKAIASDVTAISSIAQKTWNDTYTGIIKPDIQERLLGQWYSPTSLKESIEQEESLFYVAELNREVVGFVQFVLKDDARAELTRIYVLPNFQRHGIGSSLLDKGVSNLSSHGVKELFVFVEKLNSKGIGFYERSGFHKIQELSADLSGQKLDLVEYAMSLDKEENDA